MIWMLTRALLDVRYSPLGGCSWLSTGSWLLSVQCSWQMNGTPPPSVLNSKLHRRNLLSKLQINIKMHQQWIFPHTRAVWPLTQTHTHTHVSCSHSCAEPVYCVAHWTAPICAAHFSCRQPADDVWGETQCFNFRGQMCQLSILHSNGLYQP